jgi:hypothetical protein
VTNEAYSDENRVLLEVMIIKSFPAHQRIKKTEEK